MRAGRTPKHPASFVDLGGEQAEADPLLWDAFYASAQYAQISSLDDRKAFIIGRTGAGKSAILRHLEERYRGHVIRINPDNLSMPYITSTNVIRVLSDLDVNLDPFFNALWKHVLLIEIIRSRYVGDAEDTTKRFLAALREKVSRDRAKRQALDYLEEYEGKFWEEADVRVRQITEHLEREISTDGGLDLRIAAAGGTGRQLQTIEERRELAQRFQHIVNSAQLARLNKMITVLDEDILSAPQEYRLVVIDDLDRDWVDEAVANDLIRCLFRAVQDLQSVRHLKILVALRTNIFDYLNFGPSGGQEEKYRSLSLRLRWTREDMRALLDERVRASAARRGLDNVRSLADILPATNARRGNALTHILDRTSMRPRDAIAYLNECLQLNGGRAQLTWDTINAAEGPYSRNRLYALRDEWKPAFPGIDRVFTVFRGSSEKLTPQAFRHYLDDAILLIADAGFAGSQWMGELGSGVWGESDDWDWAFAYHPLVKMLYGIGFVGTSSGPQHRQTYSYDEPGLAESVSAIRDAESFSVHPAFHSALEIGLGNGRRADR